MIAYTNNLCSQLTNVGLFQQLFSTEQELLPQCICETWLTVNVLTSFLKKYFNGIGLHSDTF